jgi:aminoglycoside phosphotransferase
VSTLAAVEPLGGGAPGEAARSLREFIAASGLRSLVLATSKDPNAKVTILLVPPGTAQPSFAVKVPTTDTAERAVRNETALLVSLESALGGGAETIPRVVEVVEHHGRAALVATAVSGTPMSGLYLERAHTGSQSAVAADFASVEAWLCSFQEATGAHAAVAPRTALVDRIRTRFSDEPQLDETLARLADLESGLPLHGVGDTAVHGDFWFGNVLVDAGRRVTGVVDWEAGAVGGDPTRDIVRFAIAYALYLDRRTRRGRSVRGHAGLVAGRWGVGLEFALDGTGWFPELFRRFVRDGVARVGAPASSWREYVLAGIADVAATADDVEFARRHLELFRRLSRRQAWRAPE